MAMLLPVYAGTAPGPDVRGGLFHILLHGPDGHLHLMQKALANGGAFLLLAADLTVTQTRRKRNWSSCSRQELHLDAGWPGHAEPQAIQRPDLCPVRRAGHRARSARPAWCHRASAGRTKRRPASWYLSEYLNMQSGDISRVNVFKQKIFFGLDQCYPVMVGVAACGWVIVSVAQPGLTRSMLPLGDLPASPDGRLSETERNATAEHPSGRARRTGEMTFPG